MYRLKEDTIAELEIKKSRFPCYLHKSFPEADVREFIQQIKKPHPNTKHRCYAFIIGEQNELQRNNNDGEPQGIAGVSMLECLANRQVQDTVAVTVRYFGDIKLEAGGLIRACSESVSNALDQAIITQRRKRLVYYMTLNYELIGKLNRYFRQNEVAALDKDHEEQATYLWICKEPLDADIAEIANGRFLPEFIEGRIVDMEV